MATYRSVRERSKFSMVARSSLHPIHATTPKLSGELEASLLPDGGLDVSAPVKGRLEVEVDSMKSGNDLYDMEMQRRLDPRRYPSIIAKLVEIRAGNAPGRYVFVGDVTFHGVTRRMEGDVTVSANRDGMIEMRGEKTIDVREFGLTPPTVLFFKVEPMVKVSLEVIGQPVVEAPAAGTGPARVTSPGSTTPGSTTTNNGTPGSNR